MTYPSMSPEVFQNANIAILACQLFVMVVALTTTVVLSRKAAAVGGKRPVRALVGAKI